MIEAGREDGDARALRAAQTDAHDAPPELVAVVLPPFGDVERAAPESHAVRGRMRFEERGRRRGVPTSADEPEKPRTRPARRPAVVPATFELDDHFGRLRVAAPVDVVPAVHRDE